MSATLIGSNTTIKVNAVANGSGTSTGGSATTLITGPVAGYAIVHLLVTAVTTAGEVRLGGVTIATYTAAATLPLGPIHIGPSQNLQVFASGGNSITAAAAGVSFVNTP
jgi:hypothetical protein